MNKVAAKTKSSKSDEKIDLVLKKLEEHDHRFDQIDKRFDGVDKRLDGVDKRLDGVDKRLDGHDQQFNSINKQFNSINKQFDRVYDLFGKADKRFDKMTKMLLDHDYKLRQLPTKYQHDIDTGRILNTLDHVAGYCQRLDDEQGSTHLRMHEMSQDIEAIKVKIGTTA